MSVRVVVIGGGLSGLFAASELVAAGVDDVVVLEQSHSPGGVARTVKRDGYSLEPGAGTLMLPHPSLSPVLERFGAAIAPADPSAELRYVYTRGRLVAIPPTPAALFAPVAPFSAKIRAAAEPFIKTKADTQDESFAAFMQRRFGRRMGGLISHVAASGVYAGDAARLSARAAFPTFPLLEDDAGSVIRGGIRRLKSRPKGSVRAGGHYAVGGMSALADAAAAHLGGRFRGGVTVAAVRRDGSQWLVDGEERFAADHVVLALRPQLAARLLGGDIAGLLAQSVTAPAVVVGMGGPSAGFELPPGFGALMGPDAGTTALGILFESSHVPERAPNGHSLAKIIAGGARRPDVVDWDDATILSEIERDLARVLGREVDVPFAEIVRHPVGVPQYEVGHLRWLDELDRCLATLPNLHLTGWGYRGVGVSRLAGDAMQVAARIAGGR